MKDIILPPVLIRLYANFSTGLQMVDKKLTRSLETLINPKQYEKKSG